MNFYLPMVWQQQQQSNWCWAACTSMVCQFYIPTMFPSQCSVATITINTGRSQTSIDCCDPTVASTTGNSTWGILPPLALTGHFASMVWASMNFGALLGELSAGRPVCVQIAWRSGGGHFIVINGAEQSFWFFPYFPHFPPIPPIPPITPTELVYVEDPWYGPTVCTYSQLVNNYQGSGTWYGTFGTCSCVPH